MTEAFEYGLAGMNLSPIPAIDKWQEIQRAVESLSVLAHAEISPDHFYAELARTLVQLTSASDCKIWRRETATASQPDDSVETPGTLFQRVLVGDEVVAMLELTHAGDHSPAEREGTKHLASVAADIAADFQRNWQLRQLRDREQRREKLDRFVDRIHRTYDLRHVAYAIVAEGKELIGCDRLSLVLKRGRSCQVLAVSGVQKPDRRSPSVQCIERLVKSKIRETEPVWFARPAADANPSTLAQYFAESNAQYTGLLPLLSAADAKHKPERIGTLLVEMFGDQESSSNGMLSARADWLVRHAANALGNAVQVNRLPFLSIGRWLDRHVIRGKRIPWLILLAVPLLVGLWFIAWLPTDFRIDARGELVPINRESIYAPRAGTVVEFPLIADSQSGRADTQGTPVEAGDVVVRLENADLDYELTTLLGDQSTVNEQLATIAASIGQFGGARDAESRNRYDDLTSQAAELRIKQASIERRIRLVNQERDRLSIKASIPGRILTWDVVNSLLLRPVQQGDLLLEVADLDGPWEIELYVNDRHIGYVKRAANEYSEPLPISFFHRSDPEREYFATIQSMSMATEVYPEYGSAVRVIGKLDSAEQIGTLRPGTTIIAKIDCGKKPLAYVLGYDLIHTLRMWVLF